MELPQQRPHHNIRELFVQEYATSHGFLRASAPMVRYSKLEFRKLLRHYGVKLCFTPMIIADSFNNSEKARQNEFSTSQDDQPVIAQFAAQNALEFSTAAQLVYPYVDGVDLNCGCPQAWAIAKGYGCGLLRQPELMRDIIQTVRRVLPNTFSISLKIRLLPSDETLRGTIELARQMEKCGATFLTLHGRTPWQRSSDALNITAMADIKQSLHIPLIVNGNVRSWRDACELQKQTQADGIMAARGLLSNPALFDPTIDASQTPMECVQQWLNIATRAGDNIHFQCFHHHLTFMWSNRLRRTNFNNFTEKRQIFEFFNEHFDMRPDPQDLFDPFEYTKCTYAHYTPNSAKRKEQDKSATWNEYSNGKFFNEFSKEINADQSAKERDDFELESSFFMDY